jgi:hypothetical protein
MKIKKSVVSRGIVEYYINKEIVDTYKMKAGDLALFEVLELGKHESIQMTDGKNHAIFPGDQLVGAFADRYASAQFEGYVPEGPLPQYSIIGGGGIIGTVRTKHASLEEIEPTSVRLIGYCCDENGVINTKFYNKKISHFRGDTPSKVILSIGATMDSGKTTTAAFTARGLAMGGYKVAFIKLTGSCYIKDKEFVADCGADISLDFSDMGFPSTYMCSKEEILDIYQSLLDQLAHENPDFIVMEIADGLIQRETLFLLNDQAFMNTIDKVIFSCGDSLSALYGIQLLRKWGIELTAISGRFTMSPLLIQEVQQHTDVPLYTIQDVMTGMYNYLFTNEMAVAI